MKNLLVICLLVFNSYTNAQLPKWSLGPFIKPGNVNPILSPLPESMFLDPMTNKQLAWEESDVFNPAATVKDGKIYVLYRAEDNSAVGIGSRTSRIGLAVSDDGTVMKRRSSPVIFPAHDSQKANEWPGGCEDPRLAVTPDGKYVIFYTQWNRKVPQLAVATSWDLIHWEKSGPVFQKAYNSRFINMKCKSASIVTKVVNSKQVITKINGKYFMYWGEANVYAATSTDLINWIPLIKKDSTLQILFSPRKGYFDSQLTECGPPAVLTDKGIILVYNGKNKSNEDRDTNYTPNSYCAGQALFDANDPTRMIDRLNSPF